jgi:hypothetical protein
MTTSLIDRSWQKVSGRNTHGGVLFISYRVRISRYTRVSEDGRIRLDSSPYKNSINCEVLGHGWIKGADGKKAKRFQSYETAVKAALKLLKAAP